MESTLSQSPPTTPAGAVALPESVNRDWVLSCPLLTQKPTSPLTLDFSRTRQMDSAGAALIHLLGAQHRKRGMALTTINVPERIADVLRRSAPPAHLAPSQPLTGLLFERIGDQAIAVAGLAAHAVSVLAEMLYWSTLGLLRRRDFRRGVLLEQMYFLGYGAVGIVATLSFLVGIVLAQQTAMQLKAYGAGIFLAQMMAFSMIRELGPLLTAIILAGRTGSATTAEIATMIVGEEIDALRTMGLNPIQFVVVPKLWAITITMPLLTIVSTSAGIIGGFLVSLLYLDIPSGLFWGEVAKLNLINQFIVGFVKSVVFAWIIVWLGSFFGLRVHGGAEAVGRETTNSVVACIFAIIIADAIFSFIFYKF